MRDNPQPLRIALLVALLMNAAPAKAQSDTSSMTRDSARLNVRDTVRVWSSTLKFRGKRGVVSRVESDSLAFIAPAGFRKLPHEFVGDLKSIDRIDVLAGRKRWMGRGGGKLLLGGVIGAAGGALIGTGLGEIFYQMNKDKYQNDNGWDNRALAHFFGAVIFGVAG